MKLANAKTPALLAAASFALGLAVLPAAARADVITLHCSGDGMNADFQVDMAAGSVEQINLPPNSAQESVNNVQITERSIRFTALVSFYQFDYAIDRISGGLTMNATYTDSGLARTNRPWSRSGQCVKIANQPPPTRAF
jgi:hypothetical protein